jgi:Cys-tRNA(Pro)/Cys-tRNA(Cys) deacylase
MSHKTNAARILEGLGIAYEIREYAVDPEEYSPPHRAKVALGGGPGFSALMVAEKIGLPPEQVFKTLLCVTSDKEHLFAVVPGDAELDLKKLAAAAGARNAEMVSLKEVQPLTGYVRGGVTVFGARKDFPVYVDETMELFDVVSVSAGMRGVQVLLKPVDYLRAAKAVVADLTKALRTAAASGFAEESA